MSRRGIDACIVGGGVVGAAAALSLAQLGMRIALVEARGPSGWRPDAAPDLRVFAISPASAVLFDALGAWRGITAARAQPYRHMRVWDAAGGGELHFDCAALASPALGWIVEQSLLQHALWQLVADHPDIELYCPDSVEALEQDEDGAALTLSSGIRLRAGIVVAADGGASRLRDLAGIAVDSHDYGQRGVVAFVETAAPHQDTAWQRFLPTGPLAFLPFADGRSSIVWTLPEDEAMRVLALDDAAFARELERAFDARLGAIGAVSPRAAFPLRRQVADRFVSGRVVLAGDAAHVVHPLAGQGVNLGLQDVALLRDVLRNAVAGRDVEPGARRAATRTREAHRDGRRADASVSSPAVATALRRYARARRSDTLIAAHAFDAINRGFSNDAMLPTLLRGPALGLVDRIAPLKRWFAGHAAGWQ